MKLNTSFMTALAVIAASGAANAALTVTTGQFDPAATMQGATRFRSLNTSSSQDEIYLANTIAALATSARTVANVTWNTGATFEFGWDPSTDTIFTKVTTTANGLKTLTRSFADPAANLLPNYISIYAKDTNPLNAVTATLTDLDGNPLSNTLLGSTAGSYLSLTDPTLFQNGFILKGSISYTGTPNNNEGDKVEIAFGHSALVVVPEPSTYLAGALLGLPLLVGGVRKLRQNRGK